MMHLNTPIRRAAFVREVFGLGGSDRVTADTILLLKSLGIEMHYFCLPQGYKKYEVTLQEGKDFTMHLLPEEKHIFSPENIHFMLKLVRKLGIELLFFDTPYHAIPPELRLQTGCKLVYWMHAVPFWEVMQKRENGLCRSKEGLLKWLEWQLITRPRYFFGNRLRKKVEEIYRQNIDFCHHYIVLTPEYGEQIARELHLTPAQSSKIITLYNLVKLNPQPKGGKKKCIVFMGRLSGGDKRLDRLLTVWQRICNDVPDWELKIYGHGPKEAVLKRMAKKMALPRCLFMGFVGNTRQAYEEASICALTSTYEGWSMMLIEAQNNGVVPIAFNCSAGVQTVIGKTPNCMAGVLVPPFDIETYARELKDLCLNEQKRLMLRQNALLKRLEYTEDANIKSWRVILDAREVTEKTPSHR